MAQLASRTVGASQQLRLGPGMRSARYARAADFGRSGCGRRPGLSPAAAAAAAASRCSAQSLLPTRRSLHAGPSAPAGSPGSGPLRSCTPQERPHRPAGRGTRWRRRQLQRRARRRARAAAAQRTRMSPQQPTCTCLSARWARIFVENFLLVCQLAWVQLPAGLSCPTPASSPCLCLACPPPLPLPQRKCSYCDFPVIAVGRDQAQSGHWQARRGEGASSGPSAAVQASLRAGTARIGPPVCCRCAALPNCPCLACTWVQDQMGQYVQLLLREMEASARLNRDPLRSVFFGGGASRFWSCLGSVSW